MTQVTILWPLAVMHKRHVLKPKGLTRFDFHFWVILLCYVLRDILWLLALRLASFCKLWTLSTGSWPLVLPVQYTLPAR